MKTSFGPVVEVPPAVDTVTSTVPEPGGEVAEHEVSEVQLTGVGVAPNAAVLAPTANPLPEMIDELSPVAGPLPGVTLEIVRGAV